MTIPQNNFILPSFEFTTFPMSLRRKFFLLRHRISLDFYKTGQK
jgi:hypothetical protein